MPITVEDRNVTGRRLLGSSAKKSYDPLVDIDWDAPLADDLYFLPPHRVSLYGTDLWEQMTEQQRIELSKHELASILSTLNWGELVLMQLMVRDTYDQVRTSDFLQYALTEVGDETRHTVMFAKTLTAIGAREYRVPPWAWELGRLLKSQSFGPTTYASILILEEVFDRLQREAMNDERVQPLARQIARIHVTEEARHVSLAREELARRMVESNAALKEVHKIITALVGFVSVYCLIQPEVYEAVGLDPKLAHKTALANPHFQETLRFSGERLMQYLDEVGMLGGVGMSMWRKVFLAEQPRRRIPVVHRLTTPAAEGAVWVTTLSAVSLSAGVHTALSIGHAITGGRVPFPGSTASRAELQEQRRALLAS